MPRWDEGLVFLYDRLGRHADLLRHHLARRDTDGVMRTCRRFAEAEPRVWLRALDHLVSARPTASNEHQWRDNMREAIGAIEADALLHPVELVQRLSDGGEGGEGGEGGGVPLALVTDVLERHLRMTEAAATDQAREASRATEEMARMQAEIREIDGAGRVFMHNKCAACQGALEAPTVHFMCGHSYHQPCLGEGDEGEGEATCLVCAPSRRRLTEQQQQQRALVRNHADFRRQVESSADGFSTMMEFMARGVLLDAMPPPWNA